MPVLCLIKKQMDNFIFGLRPVIEAIKAGKEIDRILLKKDMASENTGELFALIKSRGIIVQRVPLEKLNRLTPNNHQGVIAFLSTVKYHKLDDIVTRVFDDGRDPFIVILDGITDVRNFGAIARTCDCAGVNAIVLPETGSVSVGPDAIKTSAGALLTLPVCREKNTLKAVKTLKSYGFSVIAASEKASVSYTSPDYVMPVAIVMGNEEKGISPQVLKECSHLVSIPQFGNIQSLNVSVATGIMVYEVVRQRMNKKI